MRGRGQVLAAGGLFLLGAGLLAAADAASPSAGTAAWTGGLSGAELRDRLGLDVPARRARAEADDVALVALPLSARRRVG
jgi:hypothetical protein